MTERPRSAFSSSSSLRGAPPPPVSLSASPDSRNAISDSSSRTSSEEGNILLPLRIGSEFVPNKRPARSRQGCHRAEHLNSHLTSLARVDAAPSAASPLQQPMQEGASRKRVPTQRLKSSELRETSRSQSEVVPSTSSDTVKGSRVKGIEDPTALQSIEEIQQGDLVEMFQNLSRVWQRVRVADVMNGEVYICPQGSHSASSHVEGSQSWAMRWVAFKKGLFRPSCTATITATAGSSEQKNLGSGLLGAAAISEEEERRPERMRKQPTAFSPRSKDFAMHRALKARTSGKEFKAKSKKSSKGKSKSKTAERAAAEAKKGKKVQRPSKAHVDTDASSGGSSSSHSEADVSVATGNQRRDWGLMHVDVVGRNRPPFARTLLFHGAIQAGVRFSGEPSPAKSWVVKRWPDRSARRKVDLEVHDLIRSNPCHNLVEIVDVSPLDGVLMEFCNEGDLQTLLAKSRRKYMPLREVATCFLGVMKGLAHLHKLRVVHADVSPQNVFLRHSQEGVLECVLGDFGHSYILEMHSESRSSVADHCGQGAEFVAPEVGSGSVSTMASDVYSAGKILKQMLSLCGQFKENIDKESHSLVRCLKNLSKSMCNDRPHDRPTSTKVVKELSRAITW